MPSERPQDVEAVRLRLVNWYADKLGCPQAQVREFEVPALGSVNDTYLYRLEAPPGAPVAAGDYVLRVQPSVEQTPLPYVDVLEQARTMRALERHDRFPTPHIAWTEDDADWLGGPFYVMHRSAGVPYRTAHGFDADELASMYRDGVIALSAVHDVDWVGSGLDHVDRTPPGVDAQQHQLSFYRDFLTESAEGKSYDLLERAFDWLAEHAPPAADRVFCWGDARLGNMMFEHGALTAVLDWEMAEIAPCASDVGWWLYLDWLMEVNFTGGEPAPGALMRAEQVRLYEQHSGTRLCPDELAYYQRWAAFRLGVMRMRAGRQAVAFGTAPEDSRADEFNFASATLALLFGFDYAG